MSDETRVFRFSKVPGPYGGWEESGDSGVVRMNPVTGKRGEVATNLKARAAALQATGVSAVVEEVDEQGRVLHTFPFYFDGTSEVASPSPNDDAAAEAEESEAEAALAEVEAEIEAREDPGGY